MIKLYCDAVYETLEVIFNQALISGVFSSNLKKTNIVPIHKNLDKKTLKNPCPVSLLHICGKIFERFIFNEMFRFILIMN